MNKTINITTLGKSLVLLAAATYAMSFSYFAGAQSGRITGFKDGVHNQQELWKAQLVSEGHAEYDSRTGAWKLKSLNDTLVSTTILSTAKK